MVDAEIRKELSEYNPEGSELRFVQLRLLDILIEFDRICRKNNIRYWLDSGTLIGAVRHRGFIPWDDDLDVCVLKGDLPKLQKAMLADLDSKYEFRACGPKSKRMWTRVVDRNVKIKRIPKGQDTVREEELWLDIFGMETGSVSAKKIIEASYGKCLRRKWNFCNDGKLNQVLANLLFPLSHLLKSVLVIWSRLIHKDELVHDYGNPFFSLRKKSEIFPLTDIKFEKHEFMAPHNYDAYLRRIYGDYMTIPPIESRECHGMLELIIND